MSTQTVLLAERAKTASYSLQDALPAAKHECLTSIHLQLLNDHEKILEANRLDCALAQKQADCGSLSSSLLKRLSLEGKYDSLVSGVLDVDQLEDPVGKITLSEQLDDGLELYRVSCPVGVLLIIFEARIKPVLSNV
jgi:glutamate-5-semialdehyde dehydrogenase